ncbi:MAG TPA: hypothetical protein VFE78_01825 [Gemmataceae bacterium]|nr:hypothetical protein [Gemmataceae bacterium]
MKDRDRVKLLFGPYAAPRLRRGDRATCLYRDCDVVVTGWTGARISWLRALPVGTKGHPALLVDEELARAICKSSTAAASPLPPQALRFHQSHPSTAPTAISARLDGSGAASA